MASVLGLWYLPKVVLEFNSELVPKSYSKHSEAVCEVWYLAILNILKQSVKCGT